MTVDVIEKHNELLSQIDELSKQVRGLDKAIINHYEQLIATNTPIGELMQEYHRLDSSYASVKYKVFKLIEPLFNDTH